MLPLALSIALVCVPLLTWFLTRGHASRVPIAVNLLALDFSLLAFCALYSRPNGTIVGGAALCPFVLLAIDFARSQSTEPARHNYIWRLYLGNFILIICIGVVYFIVLGGALG